MMKLSLFVLAALCAAVAVCEYPSLYEQKSYEGYELIEIQVKDERDRQLVKYMGEMDVELDFWYESHDIYHIFVAPEKLDYFNDILSRNGVASRTINNHIQQDIEEEMVRLMQKRAFSYDDFNTFEDIEVELSNMVARCRNDLGIQCELYSFGKSYEGRDLWTLKMSKAGDNRQGVWMDATIHAREWLATATHLKIMANLIDNYAVDSDVTELVDTYDFYLTPVMNPDGYVYTRTERLWRKNRTPNEGSNCIGTDLNRNYEEMWGNAGASILACSDTYRGSSAGSEPETKAVQSEARRLGPSLITSIHFHTYGQYWLIPWGSYASDGVTCNIADDDTDMMVVANAVADAIEGTYSTKWLRGNSCNVIYPASGITMDYFKAVGGIKYTSTPELRGGSFIVSPDQIEPSFQEVWNGLLALFDELSQVKLQK